MSTPGDSRVPGAKKVMPKGRPFQPGVSGNPAGVGKAKAEFDALARKSAKDVLAKLVEMAMAGDVKAAEIVLDRAWGKAMPPPPEVDPAAAGPTSVRVIVEYEAPREEVATPDPSPASDPDRA